MKIGKKIHFAVNHESCPLKVFHVLFIQLVNYVRAITGSTAILVQYTVSEL